MAVNIDCYDCPIGIGYLRPRYVQVLRFLFFSVMLVSIMARFELLVITIMGGLISSVGFLWLGRSFQIFRYRSP